MADREQQVREIAHRLWEEEGRPCGDDKRHWATAEDMVAQSGAVHSSAQTAKRAKSRKPASEGKAQKSSAGRLAGGALTH